MKETQVRSAAAFRKSDAVKLPSGLDVEMRKPDVLRLIAEAPEASVPNMIIAQFSGALGNGVAIDDSEKPKDALRKMSLFMDITVKSAVKWPVIVDNPQADDEISVTDLSLDDRQFIFTWAMPQGDKN